MKGRRRYSEKLPREQSTDCITKGNLRSFTLFSPEKVNMFISEYCKNGLCLYLSNRVLAIQQNEKLAC